MSFEKPLSILTFHLTPTELYSDTCLHLYSQMEMFLFRLHSLRAHERPNSDDRETHLCPELSGLAPWHTTRSTPSESAELGPRSSCPDRSLHPPEGSQL